MTGRLHVVGLLKDAPNSCPFTAPPPSPTYPPALSQVDSQLEATLTCLGHTRLRDVMWAPALSGVAVLLAIAFRVWVARAAAREKLDKFW